jgi:hypothetical protein
MYTKICLYYIHTVIFTKLPKVINSTKGENSLNPVTLVCYTSTQCQKVTKVKASKK